MPPFTTARAASRVAGRITGLLSRRPTGVRPAMPAVAALLAWAVVLLAVAPLVMGYLTNPPDQRLVDLDVYRSGGQSVLLGQPIYDMLTQPPQLLPFTYPPIAAVFAIPLAMLPWRVAQWVWVVLIYLPLAITIGYAFRGLLDRAGRHAPVLFAVLFGLAAYLFPMRDQIRFGQVDILLAAMCVADCVAAKPRWPRGALIGLATAVKLVPGVFIVYLWLSGRRRAALTAAAAAAAWTAGAFLLLPRDSTDYWTRAIFDSNRLGSNTGTSNQSLRGALLRLFLPGSAPTALWLALLALVAAASFRAARNAARDGHETAGVAITGLLAVLLSPVAWIHHLIWIVVALGALIGDGRDWRRVAAAAGTGVFYTVTIPWWGFSLLHVSWVPKVVGRIVQSSYGLGAAGVIALLAKTRGMDDRETPTRHPEPNAGGLAAAGAGKPGHDTTEALSGR